MQNKSRHYCAEMKTSKCWLAEQSRTNDLNGVKRAVPQKNRKDRHDHDGHNEAGDLAGDNACHDGMVFAGIDFSIYVYVCFNFWKCVRISVHTLLLYKAILRVLFKW